MSCMQKKMLSVMPVGLSHLIYMYMYFFCFCFLIFFWFCFFLFFVFFVFFILLWWLITLSQTRARFGSSRYCAQLFLLLLLLFLLFLLRPVLSWCRPPSSCCCGVLMCCVLQNVLVLDFNKIHTFIGLLGSIYLFFGLSMDCKYVRMYVLYAICYKIGIGIWNSRVWGVKYLIGCLQQLTLWSLYCCLL